MILVSIHGHGQISKDDLSFFNTSLNALVHEPEQTNKVANYFLKSAESKTEKAGALYLLFAYEKLMGNNIKSIEYLFGAKNNIENEEHQYLKALTLISIAETCRRYGMETMASEYLEKAAANVTYIYEETNKEIATARLLQEQAMGSLFSTNSEKALQQITESTTALEKVRPLFPALYASGMNAIAQIHDTANRPKEAKSYFTRTYSFLENNNLEVSSTAATTLVGLGSIYLKEADYIQSRDFFLEALKIDVIEAEVKTIALSGLSDVYKATDSLEAYNTYYSRSSSMSNNLLADERNARNTLLSFIEEDQKQSILDDEYNYFVLGGVILGILLVLLLGYYFYNKRLDSEYRKFEKIIKQLENKEKIKAPEHVPEVPLQEPKGVVIPLSTERSILERLKNFENGKDFTSADMSLPVLAKQLKTNTKYISEIIHNHKGKNFNTYINELRINYIISLMKEDPRFLNYKVSYLAEVSGFTSHSSFTVVFKSIAGITPKQFVTFLRKSNKEAS